MRKLTTEWQIRLFFIVFLVILLRFAKAPFNFLILNTILGYIPIEIGFHLLHFTSRKSILFWVLTFIWLLFFPNAPYLLTDLFHLTLLNPQIGDTGLLRATPSIWANFTLLLVSTLSCTFIAMAQLMDLSRHFQRIVAPKLRFLTPMIIVLICLLSSIGIYMGRFLRIHSVYLLLTPTWFAKQILSMWSLSMIEFTVLLTICQLIICWLLKIIRQQNATRLQ